MTMCVSYKYGYYFTLTSKYCKRISLTTYCSWKQTEKGILEYVAQSSQAGTIQSHPVAYLKESTNFENYLSPLFIWSNHDHSAT